MISKMQWAWQVIHWVFIPITSSFFLRLRTLMTLTNIKHTDFCIYCLFLHVFFVWVICGSVNRYFLSPTDNFPMQKSEWTLYWGKLWGSKSSIAVPENREAISKMQTEVQRKDYELKGMGKKSNKTKETWMGIRGWRMKAEVTRGWLRMFLFCFLFIYHTLVLV